MNDIRQEQQSCYKSVLESLHGCDDPQRLMEIYETRTTYDTEVKLLGDYKGPENLVKVVKGYVHDNDSSFLDVGAGTGLVGEELRTVGYRGRIDALEPSAEMMRQATLKGLYQNFYIEFFTPEKPCSISTGFYDVVVACGSIIPGHIKYQALTEMLRLCKTGGFVFACFRKDYLKLEHFQGIYDFLENLQRDGKCKYEMTEIDKYNYGLPGVVYVLTKL